MEIEAIYSTIMPLLRKYWLPIALASLGLIFFAYGLIGLLGSASKEDIVFGREDISTQSAQTVAVDVEGAVVNPGVYRLNQGDLIQDALIKAQGFSSDADREWVSKNINLASKLSDGTKIYIPKIGNSMNSAPQTSGENSLININSASSSELDTLPGIGEATATKIITGRPYQNINELLEKKIVSSKVFSQIKDKITAY